MTPRHPPFEDVENAYRVFYQRLFYYIDDAGAAVAEDVACSLAQDLADVWRRVEERCQPCPGCEGFPCRCEVAP